jgi:outer membrane lipoprotein-sorting protein
MISKTLSGLVLALSFGLAAGFARSDGAIADPSNSQAASPSADSAAPKATTPPAAAAAPSNPAPADVQDQATGAVPAKAAPAAPDAVTSNPAPAGAQDQDKNATPTTPASGDAALTPFVPMDPAVAVQKANAYFNSATSMVGDFVQISGDRRSEGKIYVQKPGKLRFEYADPATLDIIADGNTVAVLDRKERSDPEFYFIWQTPLKFLLKDQIDLAKDVSVVDVTSDPDTVTITVEDKLTFGGTSRIKLMFDTAQFQLKQWEVTDPQGNETLVSLFNVDFTDTPDPDLFKITENRLENTDSRKLNQNN